MLRIQSGLAAVYRACRIGPPGEPNGVTLCERRERDLLQISASRRSFAAVCSGLETILSCEMPQDCRHARSIGDRSVFRTGPERLLIAAPKDDECLQQLNCATLGSWAIITELGHSRTVLRIVGPKSRTLLNRGLPIDLDPDVFHRNSFVQSAIHHVPTLVHSVDTTDAVTFDVYVPRDFAVSFWEWLTEAAAPLRCEIQQPANVQPANVVRVSA